MPYDTLITLGVLIVVAIVFTRSVVIGVFAGFGGTNLLVDRKGIGEGERCGPFREGALNMTDCERTFFDRLLN